MLSSTMLRPAGVRTLLRQSVRCVSTLASNPHIYVFPSSDSSSHILTLLPTAPPNSSLAIGTTTNIPPTPHSLTENPRFLSILNSVLAAHAHEDPGLLAQAAAFASSSGSALGSGGMFFPGQNNTLHRKGRGGQSSKAGDGAGGASSQGGAGGGGRGGWVHVSDERAPPDYGRIAWPEDIFGSIEVDGQGNIVGDKGNWQSSGTYRVITREGILGLSDFLRGKLVQRLSEEEAKER
ncbi:hypothetical protein PVAG01_00615 [Phlyctema vagabunda]|uniref:Uncharacterized protein n=1 Tax=Phlyctema vagabunda TaxID=108571 RepID=A0ABR4PV32_9HELO